MRSTVRNVVVSCVTGLVAVAGAWAQTGTTSIRGTVFDKTGAAIVGANVTLSNPAQALQRELQTGPAGEYEFAALLRVPIRSWFKWPDFANSSKGIFNCW